MKIRLSIHVSENDDEAIAASPDLSPPLEWRFSRVFGERRSSRSLYLLCFVARFHFVGLIIMSGEDAILTCS